MDSLVLPFNKIENFESSPDIQVIEFLKDKGFGIYPFEFSTKNVQKDPATGDLQLYARPPVDGIIPSAEVNTRRNDLQFGTFRALLMPPVQNSSCFGFFSYFNDSQEVDIEFISSWGDFVYFSSKNYPLPRFQANAYENYKANFTIPGVFREYRFDWMPTYVDFYIDGRNVSRLGSPPTMPSSAIFMNWASGDVNWSGTPQADVLAQVKTMAVFFNSTNQFIVRNFNGACAVHQNETTSLCKVAEFPLDEVYGYEKNVLRLHSLTSAAGDSRKLSIFTDSTFLTGLLLLIGAGILTLGV
jgi:hypothetical protein